MAKRYELIPSDFDDCWNLNGTPVYEDMYAAAIQHVGVDIPHELMQARMKLVWGRRHQIVMASILEDYLAEQPDLWKEANRYYSHEMFKKRQYEKRIKLVPRAGELMGAVAARATLALVTGAPSGPLRRTLRRNGINNNNGGPEVSTIVSAYSIPDDRGKPDPYSVHLLMEKYGVEPEKTLVVGDSPNDIMMGHSAGARTVAVLSGHLKSRPQAELYDPDYIIDDISGIIDILRKS
jgi:phosphoglycolate phosphatase-like HAD superfamily hydrolase